MSSCILTGALADGTELEGSDSIRIVPPGDINADGFVDEADLSVLLANWNKGKSWRRGDLTGSGTVDDADLSIVLANWHAGTPPSPAPIPGFAVSGEMSLIWLSTIVRTSRLIKYESAEISLIWL